MPTDTARGRADAVKFALRGVAWSLGLFGLLRLNWTELHGVLPFTRAQAAVAVGLFGPSALPVEVTLACSGADALALCLGAILAYPVTWCAPKVRLSSLIASRLLSLVEQEKMSRLTVPVSGHVCRTACDSLRIRTQVRPVSGNAWASSCTTVAPARCSAAQKVAVISPGERRARYAHPPRSTK